MYYDGEEIRVKVVVDNSSSKTVKGITLKGKGEVLNKKNRGLHGVDCNPPTMDYGSYAVMTYHPYSYDHHIILTMVTMMPYFSSDGLSVARQYSELHLGPQERQLLSIKRPVATLDTT